MHEERREHVTCWQRSRDEIVLLEASPLGQRARGLLVVLLLDDPLSSDDHLLPEELEGVGEVGGACMLRIPALGAALAAVSRAELGWDGEDAIVEEVDMVVDAGCDGLGRVARGVRMGDVVPVFLDALGDAFLEGVPNLARRRSHPGVGVCVGARPRPTVMTVLFDQQVHMRDLHWALGHCQNGAQVPAPVFDGRFAVLPFDTGGGAFGPLMPFELLRYAPSQMAVRKS